MHQVALDRTFTQPLRMADGSTATALAIQWELFSLARKYADDQGLDCMGAENVGEEVLTRWESVLHGLESDPMSLAATTRLGGQADPDRGVPGTARVRMGRPPARRPRPPVPRPSAVAIALRPAGHRTAGRRGIGGGRGHSTRPGTPGPGFGASASRNGRWRWSPQTGIHWCSTSVPTRLRRVPMMDPLKGTAEHVEDLLEACAGPSELLDRLNG